MWTVTFCNQACTTQGQRVPRSRGPKVPGAQGPRYLKLTFKYKLDSKEGPSCYLYLINLDINHPMHRTEESNIEIFVHTFGWQILILEFYVAKLRLDKVYISLSKMHHTVGSRQMCAKPYYIVDSRQNCAEPFWL